MIFVNGFPKMANASDCMDSAMLAGMMATFDHPEMNPQLLSKYVMFDGSVYRCPKAEHDGDYSENTDNTTRDNTMSVVSGLYNYGRYDLTRKILNASEARGWKAQNIDADKPGSRKRWPNGPDRYSPSQRNHFRRAGMIEPSSIGRKWLWYDVYWSCRVSPWAEPNQLICMMVTGFKKYKQLKYWKAHHPDWKKSIMLYYNDTRPGKYDRGEKEFAQFLIEKIEAL